ncbi:hypothetical protein HPB48_021050 [Haemaphysalis longicornis]|uniref:Uncharacterized protein n=1 Tax=Haemaphysalis longicornis TaxID=44386 RepID=A0A9J6FN99_HAELO|nr:hypothetical protein HPB48_021050 [Haemaphysalis longicornis]
MFGGLPTSRKRGFTVCATARAEWQERSRFFKECLFQRLHRGVEPHRASARWRECVRILDTTTECWWQHMLPRLRAIVPKKTPCATNPIHTLEDLHLPSDVVCVLEKGPKFAVEPKKSAAELVALVRKVGEAAAQECEKERCISEGVDVLRRTKLPTCSLPSVVTRRRVARWSHATGTEGEATRRSKNGKRAIPALVPGAVADPVWWPGGTWRCPGAVARRFDRRTMNVRPPKIPRLVPPRLPLPWRRIPIGE